MSDVQTSLNPTFEVLQEFFPSASHEVNQLAGGIVNNTFLVVHGDGEKAILQQLRASSNPEATEDYAVVAEHLTSKGWEIPHPLPSIDDEFAYQDQAGNFWRAFSFLESDGQLPPTTMESLTEFAGLVGRLAFDLSDLDFNPSHTIPHFHDLDHIATQARLAIDCMHGQDQEFTQDLIDAVPENNPFVGDIQVIHGDPKLDNALYRSGKPFTMIDWDTLMRGSPLLDLADMMRSITGNILDRPADFQIQDILPIIDKYQIAAEISEQQKDEHLEQALIGTKTMCLMLAMRYMTDVVDGNYFTWDPDKYPSHADHNRARAHRQRRNAVALDDILLTG